MLYGFDTDDRAAATAALVIYAVYRSRDMRRFKVTPDLWGQVERFAKAAAKRAGSLGEFIEKLKPRLSCATLSPKWLAVGAKGEISTIAVHDIETGALRYAIQPAAPVDQREFLTGILGGIDHQQVLALIYRETAYCVLLVRDRLERERPIERHIDDTQDDDEELAA